MSYKINISLEKKESGYSASCPEITDRQFEGDSLDVIFAELKKAIQLELQTQEIKASKNAWDLLEEMAGTYESPEDWSKEHDHYLYGTPKRNLTNESR